MWERTLRTEDRVLDQYSTPGLRKNCLTREAKKEQLSHAHPKMARDERDKLLDELFPRPK